MSLIQQRIALDRLRVFGLIFVMLGALGAALAVASVLIDPSKWLTWIAVVVWLGFAVIGVVRLVRYRKALNAFEAKHGVGAGKQ